MKSFKVNDKEYLIPEKWEELTLGKYLKFYKRHNLRDKEEPIDDIYLIELVELLSDCDEILKLPMTEQINLIETLNFLIENPNLSKERTIKSIGGKEYSFAEMNSLSTGEYVSIKELQRGIKSNLDSIPYILSVILRPSKTEIDPETNDKKIILEEFSIDNLSWRAKNYPNMFMAIDVMQHITFFLTMSASSPKTMSLSMEKNKNEIPGLL